MMVRASVRGFARAMQTQPAPYRAPVRASPPPPQPLPSIRALGATSGGDTCNVLVDIAGTMPQQSRDNICRDGAAFIARSLPGQTLRVLRSCGTQPALDAGALVCP